MDALAFKSRYLAHAARAGAAAPAEVAADLMRFVSFDEALLVRNGLAPSDVRFLVQAGLPQDAAPFLTFQAHLESDLEALRIKGFCPKTVFPLGSTGSGDPVGIEYFSGAVVYLNHDDGMRRVLINSTLPQFAESLVRFQELRHARKLGSFLDVLRDIDPQACVKGAMWQDHCK